MARKNWAMLKTSLVILPLLMAGCASTERTAAQRTPYVYRLNTGDVVRVTVFGHPDLSGEYRIGEGFVVMPLSGAIPAEAVTPRELEERIVQYLKDMDFLTAPHVSVDVLKSGTIYVLGEVHTPGLYPYAENLTVVKAVAMAGGFSYRAAQNDVQITGSIDALERAPLDTLLYPGDVITINERFF